MRFLVLTILCFINLTVYAQTDSFLLKKSTETITPNAPKIEKTFKNNSIIPQKIDTSFSKRLFEKSSVNILKPESLRIKINNENMVLSEVVMDSLKKIIVADASTISQTDSLLLIKRLSNQYSLLETNPILKKNSVEYRLTNFKNYNSKDFLFYLLLAVAFIVALVKVLFPKYIKNIFDIFFQPSFRQRQTREQLTQEYVATLLLNFLFVLSTSIFVTLISSNQFESNKQFWQFLSLTFITLCSIYITKYSVTKFIGWVFHQQEVGESYNFLVFLINKIIGVVLAPLLFLISYSSIQLKQFSLTLSFIIIGLLLLYRFIKAINSLRRLLKVSGFHFFIYFCSVEILPLFILYKAIGKYIGNGI